MAYKFQIGKAKLAGSVELAEQLKVESGGIQITGSVELPDSSIQNDELENSEITVNGYATALGSSVTLGTDDVAEGSSNLYWTEARFDASLATKDTDDLAEGSNLYWTEARGESMFDSKLAAASTSDLAEGSNLYYTDARARAAVSVSDVSGDGSLSYDSATGIISYTGPSASEVRAHLSAGDGLVFADGQFAVSASIAGAGLAWDAGVLSVDTAEIAAGLSGSVEDIVDAHLVGGTGITYSAGDISIDFSEFDSGDVVEGSNLFFTDARARDAVSAVDAGGDGSFSYDSATGAFTYTGPSAAEARAHFSSADFIGYNSATGQIDVVGLPFTGSVRNAVGTPLLSGLSYNKSTGEFSVSSSIAGEALAYSGGVLNVQVDNSSVEVFEDALRIKSSGVTAAMLAGGIGNEKLVNSSLTVVAGDGLTDGGLVSLGGTVTLNVAALSADAITVTPDGIDLKPTIAGSRTFSGDVTIEGGLTVTGTTTYINTTDLVVEDAIIKIASGSAFMAGIGVELGEDHSLQTVSSYADVGNALSSSLPLVAPSMKAASFYGNLVGSMQLGIETKSANATIAANVTRATANITLTLPSSPVNGQEHRVKCFVAELDSPAVVVAAQAGATIEGEASLTLQSYGAAVSLVWDSVNSSWMIF